MAADIYALLPKVPDSDDNGRWVHCLSIPLESPALQFSHQPYKWIRYAIGVVIGAEGVLSSSPNKLIPICDNAVQSININLYYHISTEERRRMFPVDPDIARSHVTSSVHTVRKDKFRDEVAKRDRWSCFITGAEELQCDAAHLLYHSKGDEHSRDPTGDDIIHDIDNSRNDLFINKIAHVYLGTNLAFLMTPNFALDKSDIDSSAKPTEKRCTSHVFKPDLPSSMDSILLPGSPIWLFPSTDYPPAILFDVVYATAVLHHFGIQTLRDDITATWSDAFYPSGVKDAAHADYIGMTERQAREREMRYEPPNVPDIFDILMMIPYVSVPPDEVRAAMRDAKERAEAAEQRRVQEKVGAWARQVVAE